ncbi:MAG: ANL family adenylate-forming protein [Pirellulaceae bacterium]
MNRIRTLRQLLDRVPPERELWCAPGSRTIRARDIAKLLTRCGALLERIRDRNVALYAASDNELAPLLVLLDGTCSQLTLLPASLPAERLAEIVVRSKSDLLITSDSQALAQGPFEVGAVDVAELWEEGGRETAGESWGGRETTKWVLSTSGTTGEPKLVAHTLASLTRTAKQDLHKGEQYRWGSLYNLTGFAGLQVFLQSWCGGSCLILGRAGTALEERVAELIAGRCTALSATPTMWRKLLMSCPRELERLALRQITLGGEIVDQKILDALQRTFPIAKISHIYASTEAGVGFAVRDGQAGFPASYLDDPPPAIRLAVDPQGRLLLLPKSNCDEQCDEQAYVDDRSSIRRDDGFIDTGDLVVRRGDRFFFLGRANGTINVGGNKVHPEEVEEFLLGCPGVLFARVSGRKSPFTGELVQAEVVPEPSPTPNATKEKEPDLEKLKKNLLARCRAELEAYKVPAILKFVADFEATTSGKLKRTD